MKILTILAFCHDVGIRLSDKHLVYSFARFFQMVFHPALNVSMFIWSLSVPVPIFISHSAASTSHDIISGTSLGSVWVVVLYLLSGSSVYHSSIRYIILSS